MGNNKSHHKLHVTKQKDIPINNKFRVLICGNNGVGKTSLVGRLTNTYDDQQQHIRSIFDDLVEHVYTIGEEQVTIVYHVHHPEKFRNAGNSIYRQVRAVIIMYAVDDIETVNDAFGWFGDATNYSRGDSIMVVCANKCDLVDRVVLDTEQMWDEHTKNYDMEHHDLSVKDNVGVVQMITSLTQQLYSRHIDPSTHL